MAIQRYLQLRPAQTRGTELGRRIRNFLVRHVEEGTVDLPIESYDSSDSWTVGLDDRSEVAGFSAHRVREASDYAAVQVHATYVAAAERNRQLASLLLQGPTFLRLWSQEPARPLFMCGRTRNPAAYKAALRSTDVLPSVDRPMLNSLNYPLARELATTFFGEHAELDCHSYALRGSYGAHARFLRPRFPFRDCPVTRYFSRHIDYAQDETLFFFAPVTEATLLRFAAARVQGASLRRASASPSPQLNTEKVVGL